MARTAVQNDLSLVGSPALARITALIVRAVAPEAIWLFGSQAKGTAGVDSDVDLLVVGAFRGPVHRRARELRGLLDAFPMPIDLHLLTAEEVATVRRTDPHSWLATLSDHAHPIYVAPELTRMCK
jgi:predicted nucleotidyltransferase